MKRGEVWWINFEPSMGGGIRKKRPAVVVSNDAANKYLNRIQVVPLTSKIGRIYPSEALVTVWGQQSKALADQITTVSKQRVFNHEDTLSSADVRKIERAINIQLGLRKN